MDAAIAGMSRWTNGWRRVRRARSVKTNSKVKLGLAVLLAVLLLVLVLQNTGPVAVNLFFWTVNGPLVILVLVTGALGVGLGVVLTRLLS